MNKLKNEKSPYLRQHADNPVEWHPWGEEALRLAQETRKPIFLSIGYATCHWCHVMAHESFENKDIAALMNKHFINIKVDREERPDIDAIYMAAIQALTGSGGWPMSVWLTPDLKPFYGGTYFPPEDRYGRPGFPSVIDQLAEIYKKEPHKITEAANDLTHGLTQALSQLPVKSDLPNASEVMKRAFETLRLSFDSVHGGFGRAPKFPMPVYLDFLLTYFARSKETQALEMVKKTFHEMIRGGLYDQLGGGFARYSTDEKWTTPHFEKMLYDNSQLILSGLLLYQATKDRAIKNVVEKSVEYVLRDLRHPKGGFYSAEDADSEGKEGAFYLWTLAEINLILPNKEAEMAGVYFGITANGNFFDPHTQEAGQNVLVQAKSAEDLARHFQISVEDAEFQIKKITQKLFHHREKRTRPFRDEKIIGEWNGLMISALAHAGSILQKNEYIEAAEKAAFFLKETLYDPVSKTLYRRWCDGERAIEGHQIDYAMLVRSLIDLFQTTGRWAWMEWAQELQEQHDFLFLDGAHGGYFMTVERADLLVRMKDDADNVIPSGNSVAVLNGIKLAVFTGRPRFRENALETLKTFSRRLGQHPTSLCSMLVALDFEQNGHAQIVLAVPTDNLSLNSFQSCLWSVLLPQKIVVPVLGPHAKPNTMAEWINSMKLVDNQTTGYICQNFTCQKPTTDLREFSDQLNKTVVQSF